LAASGSAPTLRGTLRRSLTTKTTLFGLATTFAIGYRALYQDYHHRDFEWDVTMHGPVFGTAVHF
jgi:hypothetical protein